MLYIVYWLKGPEFGNWNYFSSGRLVAAIAFMFCTVFFNQDWIQEVVMECKKYAYLSFFFLLFPLLYFRIIIIVCPFYYADNPRIVMFCEKPS